MKHYSTALTILFLAGFSAAAQQVVYRYNIDQPYKYLIESKNDVSQDFGGQIMNSSIEYTSSISLRSKEVREDGSTLIKITVDNALAIIESPQGTQTMGSELSGKSAEIIVGREGKVLNRGDAMKELGEEAQVIGTVLNLFPRLDPNKLEVGNSWEIQESDTTGGLISNTRTSYSVLGKKTVKDRACLEIEATGKRKVQGKSSRMGRDFNVMGEITNSGKIYYDPADGILIELQYSDTGDQAISDPNNASMKINITTSGNGKVEYIP